MRLNTYILEKRNVPKIYFAHPRATYDASGEEKAIGMLEKAFPEYIIVNPNTNWIQGKVDDMGFDIFFKVIDTVEFVAALPLKNGKITFGTWRECQYAHKKGKTIYVVDPFRNKLEIVPFGKLKSISAEDTYALIPQDKQAMYKMYEDKIAEIERRKNG